MTRFKPDEVRIAEASSKPSRIWANTASLRKAAEHLIEIADGHVASWLGTGGSAFKFAVGAGFVCGRESGWWWRDFFQSAGQQLVAHFGEAVIIVDPILAPTLLPILVPTLIPIALVAEAGGELWSGVAVGGVHELDVLHVLFGGAVDDGGDGFGGVIVDCEFELVEGGEEMVVAGLVAGTPVAHRPGVDDLVVEDVVVIGAADGGLGRVMLAGIAGRSDQA